MDNTVYLIDYENVSYKGLYGISEIKPDDEIIIFYSNDISIIKDIIEIYNTRGVTLKYYQLDKTGKNALDFMISAYAGYAASKENISRIAILSNDKGYFSIATIIEAVNPEIELIFESCIHNVIHPDDKKDIISPGQSSDNNSLSSTQSEPDTKIEASLPKPVTEKVKTSGMTVSADTVKKSLNNIPAKYRSALAGLIAKCLKNNLNDNEVQSAISKQLGKKKENAPYKQHAFDCYRKIKNS